MSWLQITQDTQNNLIEIKFQIMTEKKMLLTHDTLKINVKEPLSLYDKI